MKLWNGASSGPRLGEKKPDIQIEPLVPLRLTRMVKLREEPRNLLGLPRIAECAVGENQCFQAKEEETFANQINQILKSRPLQSRLRTALMGRCPKPRRSPPRRLGGTEV